MICMIYGIWLIVVCFDCNVWLNRHVVFVVRLVDLVVDCSVFGCVVLFTKPGYGRLLWVKNRHVYICAEVSHVVVVVVEVGYRVCRNASL